jgi:hypothetical protein
MACRTLLLVFSLLIPDMGYRFLATSVTEDQPHMTEERFAQELP